LTEGSPEAEKQNPKLYSLDITHPGAAQWLGANLFKRVVNDWGYDFIKIDFVEWSLLAADRYSDPTITKAANLPARGGNHASGDGPAPASAGLRSGQSFGGPDDSMRIELDQPPVTWGQYFLHSASSAPAAAKRYYFHKRTWINDDDHVVSPT